MMSRIDLIERNKTKQKKMLSGYFLGQKIAARKRTEKKNHSFSRRLFVLGNSRFNRIQPNFVLFFSTNNKINIIQFTIHSFIHFTIFKINVSVQYTEPQQ